MSAAVEEMAIHFTGPLTDHRAEMSADLLRGRITVQAFTAQEWNRHCVAGANQTPDDNKFVGLQPAPLTFDVIFGFQRLTRQRVRAVIPVLSKLIGAKLKLTQSNHQS